MTGVQTRNATTTRRQLMSSARQHFARDGYAGAKVRDIAADAGVNVALINRYFESKEGLFEACVSSAADELARDGSQKSSAQQVAHSLVRQVSDAPNGEQQVLMMLLLRSSGDERVEQIRRATLESFARRMAVSAGLDPDGNPDHALRAQIALATVLGMVLLRSSSGAEPLTSATEDELAGPLEVVFRRLLSAA